MGSGNDLPPNVESYPPLLSGVVGREELEDFFVRSQGAFRQGLRPSERVRGVIYGVVFVLLSALMLIVPLPWESRVNLKVGDVSPVDIRAPRKLSYVSEVLTKEARDRAAASVPNYYLPPDPSILRGQIALAQNLLDYISTVRSDPYASFEEKRRYLKAVSVLSLSDKAIDGILRMSDSEWQQTGKEVLSVLSRAMSREIREDQLPEARRTVPTLISAYMNETQSLVVSEMVTQLLKPNALYDKARTEEEREKARESVKPVTITYEKGEIIVRAGDVVTPTAMEALEKFGIVSERRDWRKSAGTVLLVLVFSGVMAAGLWREESYWIDPVQPKVLLFMFLLFVLLARLMVPGHVVLGYLYPLAVLAMVTSAVVGLKIAVFGVVLFGVLVGYLAGGSLNIGATLALSSITAPIVLGRGERMSRFTWAGVAVATIGVALYAAMVRLGLDTDLRDMFQVSGALITNGILSIALTILFFYLMGSVLEITTPLQLIELSRPTSPLLRQLLLKAPGTYHHSLVVANMAERAADAIGADSFLVRVGAYYHDIGKLSAPYFFSENQMEGMNPHERLDPYTSAQIIIKHVTAGLKMAEEHDLPREIRDFIPQHHGTMLIRYFYAQAVKEAGDPEKVDEKQFRYPGPKPQSKETAILMLADGVEAAVRATAPKTQEDIDRILRRIFAERILDGQLDESRLTLYDLNLIRQAFLDVLKGLYHPRVKYPELKKKVASRSEDGENAKDRGSGRSSIS